MDFRQIDLTFISQIIHPMNVGFTSVLIGSAIGFICILLIAALIGTPVQQLVQSAFILGGAFVLILCLFFLNKKKEKQSS